MTAAVARLSDAFLDGLRARVDLPALVARGVRLQRAGRVWMGLCPFHGERNPSFAVYADHYHCFGCGVHGDAVDWVQAEQKIDFLDAVSMLCEAVGLEPPVRRQVRAERAPLGSMQAAPRRADDAADEAARIGRARAMWLSAEARILDTPVDFYLRGRGIDLRRLPHSPGALRFAPSLWCEDAGRRYPAMVAAISSASGHCATHRTWLDRDASGRWVKAPVAKPKKVLGVARGGSIRLSRGASGRPLAEMDADERPAIGEGIETCLSVAIACPEMRLLAGVSLGGMAFVDLPAQARSVLLLADNDAKPAVQRVFERVVAHHIALERDVRVARSPRGNDFNDALQRASRDAVGV